MILIMKRNGHVQSRSSLRRYYHHTQKVFLDDCYEDNLEGILLKRGISCRAKSLEAEIVSLVLLFLKGPHGSFWSLFDQSSPMFVPIFFWGSPLGLQSSIPTRNQSVWARNELEDFSP